MSPPRPVLTRAWNGSLPCHQRYPFRHSISDTEDIQRQLLAETETADLTWLDEAYVLLHQNSPEGTQSAGLIRYSSIRPEHDPWQDMLVHSQNSRRTKGGKVLKRRRAKDDP